RSAPITRRLAEMATHRGFVVQPTYRLESGRAVVHLYGVLEDGRRFLVRDRRPVPHFYVEAKDAAHALRLGARVQAPADRVTLTGRPAVRVEGEAAAGASPPAAV